MYKYKNYVVLEAANDEDTAVWAQLCVNDDLKGYLGCDAGSVKYQINDESPRYCIETYNHYTDNIKMLAYWNCIAIKQECYDKYITPEAKEYDQRDGDLPEVQALIGQKVLFSDTPAMGKWFERTLLNIRGADKVLRYECNDYYAFIKTIPGPTVTEVTMSQVCEKFGKNVKIIK